MPVTPLHYVAAYAVNKAKKGLAFPALIVGSLIPDAEPVVGYLTNGLLPPRGFLHSLLGAVTLDTFLAVLVTVLVYPVLVTAIFRVEKKSVAEKCQFSSVLVLSALVGCLFHVLIDITNHEYNPFLYPFTSQSFDTFVLFNDWASASMLVHVLLLGTLLAIFVYELNKGARGFWKRLLVE